MSEQEYTDDPHDDVTESLEGWISHHTTQPINKTRDIDLAQFESDDAL